MAAVAIGPGVGHDVLDRLSLQYTQNRDTRAIQLKLDEILRANSEAHNELMKLEQLSDSELTQVEDEILHVRQRQHGSPGA